MKMCNKTQETICFGLFVHLFFTHLLPLILGSGAKSCIDHKNQLMDNNSMEPLQATQKQLGEQRSWTALKIQMQVFSVLRDGSERCVRFFDAW